MNPPTRCQNCNKLYTKESWYLVGSFVIEGKPVLIIELLPQGEEFFSDKKFMTDSTTSCSRACTTQILARYMGRFLVLSSKRR